MHLIAYKFIEGNVILLITSLLITSQISSKLGHLGVGYTHSWWMAAAMSYPYWNGPDFDKLLINV